jgi:ParB family transcriptional regulator, chromosome partitioning protein
MPSNDQIEHIESTGPAVVASSAPGNSGEVPGGPYPPAMIPVGQLAGHPGNVREDLSLGTEFCASIAETGVRIPLIVTPSPDGLRVIEGHRRLAAAVKAGLAEVPCVLDPAHADDEAGQFLDMVLANSGAQRRNFTPIEEAAALFAAHQAGATRTRIRKATGRKAEEVKTALHAGGMSSDTRAAAGELAAQLSLDQLALLAEFDGDAEAIEKITNALRHGYTADYVAERIRQDRAEAAEHDRLRAELEAAGFTVTDDLPAGAERLAGPDHDGEELTPDAHAACPGRGVFFPSWNRLHPVHYCASPAEHGHTSRYAQHTATSGADTGTSTAVPPPGPPEESTPDPGRRLVIEGNKAWAAAAEVRKRWLRQFFARRAAPREVARFVAEQLLTMPEPLRLPLPSAHTKPLFTEITGRPAHVLMDDCGTCPAARLPLLMLAPIAVAYEGEMDGADASRRATWREDRYSPCSRQEAGRYLAFLASLGSIRHSALTSCSHTGRTSPSSWPAAPSASSPELRRRAGPSQDGRQRRQGSHAQL